MDIQAFRQPLQQPISQDSPAGSPVESNATLEFIENQMIKVGSLAHGEVDWDKTEQKVIHILCTQSKDIKLLSHLLQCLQNQATADRFVLSLYVLADFIATWWDSCYPAPGKKGERIRRRFFAQMIQRSVKCAGKLAEDDSSDELKSAVTEALTLLRDAAGQHELELADINSIERLVSQPRPQAASPTDSGPDSESSVKTTTSARKKSTSVSNLSIDSSNDRAIRKSLLHVADFLAGQEHGFAMSLRMRRQAIWSSITSAPDADATGETQLAPVSADRVAEYQQQCQQSPDQDLWQRVEQSLTLAPYWLDGHELSARIARQLGYADGALAIRDELHRFLQRLPKLSELHFKGGQPFISRQTLAWVSDQGKTASVNASDWQTQHQQARQMAQEQGLTETLSMLNEALGNASELRE
ncbi:MAG: type VI secretion system protein TssA, partial [Reinekea sp.]